MKKFKSFINESKKSQADFLKRAEALILQYGTLVNDWGWSKEFDIPTVGGNYRVSLYDNSHFQNKGERDYSKLYTIFGRFDDVKKASEYPFIADGNFNKYSGKYNFHYLSAEDCLNMFKGFVDEIAIPKS